MDTTTWTHWSPADEMFGCDPKYRAEVEPPLAAETALKLDANRKTPMP